MSGIWCGTNNTTLQGGQHQQTHDNVTTFFLLWIFLLAKPPNLKQNRKKIKTTCTNVHWYSGEYVCVENTNKNKGSELLVYSYWSVFML